MRTTEFVFSKTNPNLTEIFCTTKLKVYLKWINIYCRDPAPNVTISFSIF